MNILFIAPEPFYSHRGSPIAVRMMLDGLDRRGQSVDLVTYHEGEDVPYENVTIHRIPAPPFVRGVRPGFSIKKVVCDVVMIGTLVRLLRRKRYDVVHAVEEGVFHALWIKVLLGIPYVYDMDSSLVDQMIDRHRSLVVLRPLFRLLERGAVRNALSVVAVCDALGAMARRCGSARVVVLYDVPMPSEGAEDVENFREALGLRGVIALYVGNLESYQGIDLLLDGFALADPAHHPVDLVVVGGGDERIARYRRHAERLGIGDRVHFLGPRPVTQLYGHLSQADILLSPRTQGYNTPMKIYSYLASGKPILATRLQTHTQVLDERSAVLTEPSPAALAEGLRRLMGDPDLRSRIGEAGKDLVDRKYNEDAFARILNEHLDWLEDRLSTDPSAPVAAEPEGIRT